MADVVENVVADVADMIVAEFVHDDDVGKESVDGTDDGADHKNNNQDDRCVGMYHNTGVNVEVVKIDGPS